MKILLVLIGVTFCVCLFWYLFQPVRVETYLFAPSITTTWVFVEYGRSDCTPLSEGFLGREIRIPADGYLCTSSPMEMGWTYNLYYLDGNPAVKLDSDSNILSKGSIHIIDPDCRVVAETFLLKLQVSDRPSNSGTRFIETYHPECTGGIDTELK